MLIFDAHLDIAWNALEWNRNLDLPAAKIREFEKHFADIVPGDCTVTYPELERGGVGIMIATLLPRLHRKDKPLTFYQSRESTYGAGYGQIAYYRAMCRKGVLRELPDWPAVEKHVAEWDAALRAGSARPPLGYILSMEGAPPILHPEQVHEWYAAGLRIVGPAHYGPNEYCHGTGSVGGLSADGRRLLQEMDKAGMLLDATHLADDSFWERSISSADRCSPAITTAARSCRETGSSPTTRSRRSSPAGRSSARRSTTGCSLPAGRSTSRRWRRSPCRTWPT